MAESRIAQEIAQQSSDIHALNDAFCAAQRPHALLITNHGYAGPTFPAGAPDSGGQITYVNQLAKLLATQGYRVTIAARSFTPDKQFAEFGDRRGVHFMDDEPFVRYIFVPDDVQDFILKEQIYDALPKLAQNLADFIDEEASAAEMKPWNYIAWINSHYVDAGTIGQLIIKRWMDEAGSNEPKLNKHAWTPHSLGKLKEQNMLAMDEKVKRTEKFKQRFTSMNFETREEYERALIGSSTKIPEVLEGCPRAATLVTTSAAITETFAMLDASSDIPLITFPPGTNVSVYSPRKSVNEPDVQKLFAFMRDILPADLMKEIALNPQKFNIIVEAGRMDATKRKQIPIAAMTELSANALLFVTGKRDKQGIYDALEKTIDNHGLDERVFLLGMVPDELMAPLMSLPHGERDDQFRLAIGVSASRMEGWGMAVMDMTAGGMPLVSSPLVPYAMRLQREDEGSVTIVPLSDDESTEYAKAFQKLIDNPQAAREQALKGHRLAQHFDWAALVKNFAHEIEKLT